LHPPPVGGPVGQAAAGDGVHGRRRRRGGAVVGQRVGGVVVDLHLVGRLGVGGIGVVECPREVRIAGGVEVRPGVKRGLSWGNVVRVGHVEEAVAAAVLVGDCDEDLLASGGAPLDADRVVRWSGYAHTGRDLDLVGGGQARVQVDVPA